MLLFKITMMIFKVCDEHIVMLIIFTTRLATAFAFPAPQDSKGQSAVSQPCGADDAECIQKQQMKEQRLNIIKSMLLIRLNMTSPPNVTKEDIAKVTKQDVDRAKKLGGVINGPLPTFPTQSLKPKCNVSFSKKTFNYTAEKPGSDVSNPSDNVLQFTLQRPEGENIKVMKAKLHMYLQYKRKKPKNDRNRRANKKRSQRKKVMLQIYRIIPAHPSSREQEIATITVEVKHTKWQKITIPTWVVEDAYKENRVLQLKVVCQNCDQDGPKLVTLFKNKPSKRLTRRAQNKKTRKPPKKRYHKKRPFLEVRTKQSRERPKRDLGTRTYIENSECRSRPIMINFMELGWDSWILDPFGYRTLECLGEGNRPTKMTSIDLLYVDRNGKIVLSRIPDFIIKECLC